MTVRDRRKMRICEECDAIDYVTQKSTICATCSHRRKLERSIESQYNKLSKLDITDIAFAGVDNYLKNLWKFTHSECSTRQTWVYGNLKKQIDLYPNETPCKICGAKRRMLNAYNTICNKLEN